MKITRLYLNVLLILMFLSCSCIADEPIYTYREEIPVSDSITLTKVEEFYSDRSLSYSYIRADLSNENTSLKLLKSDKGTDIVETVGKLAATENDTVAAINGDFYSVFSGAKGFALGIEVKDGELLQSPINPDTMATVTYNDGAVNMSYLDFGISVVAPGGEKGSVRHLNKHTSYFGDILMYTSDFNGGFSPAPGGDVAEVVVSDGKVTEIRVGQPAVEIPEDGCVLVVSEGMNPFFANNIKVGDEIVFEYSVFPELQEGQTSFGGGAMLVENGEVVSEYSHVISGRQPRSAVGVDESGKVLYLVAVNGRQDSSRGLTMNELSELMLKLGCYNAVNLDGGGSTHMTASTVWNEDMHTVNSPTENRKVINAVGLVYSVESEDTDADAGSEKDEDVPKEKEPEKSTADDSLPDDGVTEKTDETEIFEEPAGIMLKSNKQTVFIGHPVELTVAAHDENMRPVKAQTELFSAFGTVEDGIYIPAVGGWTTVEAVCGDMYASTEIFVVDTVAGIDIPSHIRMNEGESTELKISVFDTHGNYVEVTDVSEFEIYSSDPSVVSVSDRTVTALTSGTAIVSVMKEGVQSNISVAVGTEVREYYENFRLSPGVFRPYPDKVDGAFEISTEQAYSGIASGKLSFDFADEVTQVVEQPDEAAQPETTQIEEAQDDAVQVKETQDESVQTVTEQTDEQPETEQTKAEAVAEDHVETEQNETEQNEPKQDESEQDEPMGAYLKLDERILLANAEKLISVKFYSENDFTHELKAQFVDGSGNLHIVSFGDTYKTGEWQELSADISEIEARPLMLDSIYVLYRPGDVKDEGCIYLDDLTFNTVVPVKYEAAEANSYVIDNLSGGEINGQFAAGSLVDANGTIYESYLNERTVDALSVYTDVALLGNSSSFRTHEDENALYIKLDTSKGGIRNSDSKQWTAMTQAIESTHRNNVFILADYSIFGSSEFENRVIKDYLADLEKNVFVITSGTVNTYKNINGVKYFTLGNNVKEHITVTHLSKYSYLLFSFTEEQVVFEWKSLL